MADQNKKKKSKNVKGSKSLGRIVLVSVAMWAIVCLILTELIGRKQFAIYAEELEDELESDYEIALRELKGKATSSKFDLNEDRALIEFSYGKTMAALADATSGTTYVTGALTAFDVGNSSFSYNFRDDDIVYRLMPEDTNKVYMQLLTSDLGSFEYFSSPKNYFTKVYEETYALKGNVEGRWNNGVADCWDIIPKEGYVKGSEFLPTKVHASYTGYVKKGPGTYMNGEAKDIDCSGYDIPEGYEAFRTDEYADDFILTANIVFFGQDGKWEGVSKDELMPMGYDICNREFTNMYNRLSSTVHNSFITDQLFVKSLGHRMHGGKYSSSYLDKSGNDPIYGISVPFSFLKGDVAVGFTYGIRGVNGQRVNMYFFSLVKGGLAHKVGTFFRYMRPLYIGLAILFVLFTVVICRLRRRDEDQDDEVKGDEKQDETVNNATQAEAKQTDGGC